MPPQAGRPPRREITLLTLFLPGNVDKNPAVTRGGVVGVAIAHVNIPKACRGQHGQKLVPKVEALKKCALFLLNCLPVPPQDHPYLTCSYLVQRIESHEPGAQLDLFSAPRGLALPTGWPRLRELVPFFFHPVAPFIGVLLGDIVVYEHGSPGGQMTEQSMERFLVLG